MKSLADLDTKLEHRTPISVAPFTISTPGSYYLTTNITAGSYAIYIIANNVTLDLNGYTIGSTAPSATSSAIGLGTVTNVAIYNGHISSGVTNSPAGIFGGGGFAHGIYGIDAYNVRVNGVSVVGVLDYGIGLGLANSTTVEACAVIVAGTIGIGADNVADSTALSCGNVGIAAGTAQSCRGSGVGNGTGLSATTAINCYGFGSGTGAGLSANAANNCLGRSSGSGDGLDAATASNCNGYGSGTSTGLNARVAATGCYGVSGSGTGLHAFIGTSCSGSSLNITHGLNS